MRIKIHIFAGNIPNRGYFILSVHNHLTVLVWFKKVGAVVSLPGCFANVCICSNTAYLLSHNSVMSAKVRKTEA